MKNINSTCEILGALANPKRFQLAELLEAGAKNVTALVNATKFPQASVSALLNQMRIAGVVTNKRDGQAIFYSLSGRGASMLSAIKASER
jgi:DNA-binding transcriptional ArsR family regulator